MTLGIDFSVENSRKLLVVAAKARCNAQSSITECFVEVREYGIGPK